LVGADLGRKATLADVGKTGGAILQEMLKMFGKNT